MKAKKMVCIGLLIALLVSVPVMADAHWGFGGGLLLGFGTGLITGFAFAPRPVYVSPPVYYPAPYYVAAPASVGPAVYGYSGCREWSIINRHWENRWDPYYGRWRAVMVERWGWVPCR